MPRQPRKAKGVKPKKELEVTFKSKTTGRFLPGNRFWEARSTHGRDKIFSTPAILADACRQYFEWVEENPLYESKAFQYEGVVSIEPMPKMRAMSIRGLCIFLDIVEHTWWDYAKRPEFSQICQAVKQVIDDQKFNGAAAGLLVASIIARDLGLADKKELTGGDGAPIRTITTDMSPKEAAEAWRAVLNEDSDT